MLGKPGGKVTVTGCVEVLSVDPVTQLQTLESLCSVGENNVWGGTRATGGGKLQNGWENVSAQLLTVCVDKTGDGVCDDRVGLFDAAGEDYWWNWDAQGRAHVQLVFFAAQPGTPSLN